MWPDDYDMSINQFTCLVAFCFWAGQGAVVFERDRMLNGLSVRGVYFDLYFVDPNLGGMLPANLDGTTLPPAGAEVSGSWSNGATGTASCTTAASGAGSVSKTGIRNRIGSVTFTVTNVTRTGLTYMPVENHDPDGDSTGTAITIIKP